MSDIQIIQGDCLEIMKTFADNQFDLVLTDPPYGIGRDALHEKNKGNWGFKQYGETDWDKPVSREQIEAIIRIGKNQIIFGANYFPQYLPPSMCWVFWYKMQPNFSFSDGEFAFTSFQSKARIFQYARGNESGFAPCVSDNAGINKHPTQKPVALMKWCLENYTNEGDTVLDPFLGSGTTAVACERMGRNCVGIEISEEYCEIARKRVQEEKDKMGLFNGD